MDPSHFGTFEDLCYRAYRFNTTQTDPDQPGVLVLSERTVARPTLPLTDEKCPVLMILWHLRAAGWHYAGRKCTHTLANLDDKLLDGRDTMRHKVYYMCLCRLQWVLERTSALPSDQSQLFYRLLLHGKTVEPDLPLADYIQLGGGRAKIKALPFPEPGIDAPLPLPAPPELDPDLVVAVEEPAKKRARPRAKASVVPLPKGEGVSGAAAPAAADVTHGCAYREPSCYLRPTIVTVALARRWCCVSWWRRGQFWRPSGACACDCPASGAT